MHDRISINSICFMGTSFDQQAEFWSALKPQRVSLLGPQIPAEGIEKAQQVLASGNYQLETIVQPFLSGQSLMTDETQWQEPRQRIYARIDEAVQLGGQSIYMTTGGHGGMTWEQAAETFTHMIEPCAQRARDAGIALMIENAPTLYADIHIGHSLRDTVTLAEMAGIGVCIDLPGCWTEADLKNTIERAVPRCSLVQVGDYVCGDRFVPSRAVPGDGDMPLRRLFDWLLAAGYKGAFDFELLGPRIDEEGALSAVQRAGDYVSELLVSLDA